MAANVSIIVPIPRVQAPSDLDTARSMKLMASVMDHLQATPCTYSTLHNGALVAIWSKPGAYVNIKFHDVVTMSMFRGKNRSETIFDKHVVMDKVHRAIEAWRRAEPSSLREVSGLDALDEDIAF